MITAARLSLAVAVAAVSVLSTTAPGLATETRRVETSKSPDDQPDKKSVNRARAYVDRGWVDDAPAPMEAPQLRNVEPRTRLYVDGSFAETKDLSALPHIAGSGRNYKLSFGGSLKWRRFQFDAELPASQLTTVSDLINPDYPIDSPSQIPVDDRQQMTLSIGDLRLGTQWTHALPIQAMPISAGFGIRLRVPTHTTRFQFYNDNNSTVTIYALPYYFHVEPALLVGGALGPFSFVMNQGILALLGPDGRLGNVPIVVPSLYFWDAHYAVACRIFRLLGISVELNTILQLNHVEGLDFQKLNNVFAMAITPALQWHLGRYRVDTVARFGLNPGSELMGVVAFAGTRSFMVRLGRVFD